MAAVDFLISSMPAGKGALEAGTALGLGAGTSGTSAEGVTVGAITAGSVSVGGMGSDITIFFGFLGCFGGFRVKRTDNRWRNRPALDRTGLRQRIKRRRSRNKAICPPQAG